MKKVLVSLLILMVCSFAFADTSAGSSAGSSTDVAVDVATNNLSTAAVNNFTNKALFIQTSENTNVYTNLWNYSAYGYSSPIDFYFNGPSYVYTETKVNWTPYQGSIEISKDQFYNLIGRTDLAADYLTFQKSRRTWSNVTIGSLVSSLGFVVGGALTKGDISDCLYAASAISLVVSGVGLFVLDVVLVEEDLFTVSFAMNAAQTYNMGLLATISTN